MRPASCPGTPRRRAVGRRLRLVAVGAALAASAILSGATASEAIIAPAPVLPETLRWTSPPGNPALQAAWMLGSEGGTGAYVLRVRLAAGGKILPHRHPDARHVTVLWGTVYVGFGESFDESKVVAVPSGAVYVAAANVPHFVWARDGGVVYQESGVGPTANVFIAR